jgi:hypothetical protein
VRLFVDEGLPAGYAAGDGVALRFAGRELVEAVASWAGTGAYRVEPGVEPPIEPPLLRG